MEVWGLPGARAWWPRIFSGGPPYGKWWRGSGRQEPFSGVRSPGGRFGAVFPNLCQGEMELNFSTFFDPQGAIFRFATTVCEIFVIKLYEA